MAVGSSTSSPSSLAQAVNVRALSETMQKGSSSTVLTASTSVASTLSAAASASARPTFNLTFNQLQNVLIDRLNQRINEVTSAQTTSHLKEILLGQRQQLVNVAEAIGPVQDSLIHNNAVNNAIGDQLADLNLAVEAAADGDPTQFDAILASINGLSDGFTNADGSYFGLIVGDGSSELKANGLVRYADADGTLKRATSYADFGGDSTAALSAITQAIYRSNSVSTGIQNRADVLYSIMQQTQTSIDSIDAQISGTETLDLANQAGEIAKLKQEYGLLLQNLSYAFEGSQAMVSALGAAINGSASDPAAGSVVNLFT